MRMIIMYDNNNESYDLGSTLFVTMASTETLIGTTLGVTLFRGRNKVTPKVVPFSKKYLTI